MYELTTQLNEPTVLFTNILTLEKRKKRSNTILKMFFHSVCGIIIGVLIGIFIIFIYNKLK
jgi:hypothetical protein